MDKLRAPTHRFYRLPSWIQWSVAVLLFAAAIAPWVAAFYWPLILVAFPLLVSWHLFSAAPMMTLLGLYRYFSPCLLGLRLGPRLMDLHIGTLFDDVFGHRNAPQHAEHRETILCVFRGLLAITEDVRDGRIPREIKIRGMLLYFNARNMKSLGFTVDMMGVVDRLVVAFGFVQMAIRTSIKSRRFSLPRFREFKLASTTGEKLLAHSGDIELIVSGLEGPPRKPTTTRHAMRELGRRDLNHRVS